MKWAIMGAVTVLMLSGVTLAGGTPPPPQPEPVWSEPPIEQPAFVYIIYDSNRWADCSFTSGFGPRGARYTPKKGQYARAEAWPGTLTVNIEYDSMFGNWCDNRTNALTFQITPGENFLLYGPVPGETTNNYTRLTTEQGRAMIADRKMISHTRVTETADMTQLGGGRYYGPAPYTYSFIDMLTPREVRGQVTWRDGRVYRGQLDGSGLIDGEMHYSFYTRYDGTFKGFLPSGEGRMWYEDGTFYEGGFAEGVRSGPGREVKPDGSVFIGNFDHDVADGEGICGTPGEGAAYCAKAQGQDSEPEPLEAMAKQIVDENERKEVAEALAPLDATIAEADTLVEQYSDMKANEPNAHYRAIDEMTKHCQCYLHGCIEIKDAGVVYTEAQKQAFKEKDALETKRCVAWRDGRAGLDDEAEIARQIAYYEGIIQNENAKREEAERQKAAETARLAREQAEARAARLVAAKQAAAESRQEAANRQRNMCEQRPKMCGCNAILGKPEPARQPGEHWVCAQ